jgi:hypothetical protein
MGTETKSPSEEGLFYCDYAVLLGESGIKVKDFCLPGPRVAPRAPRQGSCRE